MRPALIALDVDGTILDSTGVISPAVRSAITRARAAGAHVVLSTGRTVLGVRNVISLLGFTDGTVLCSNGAVRLDLATGEVIALATFEPAPVIARLRSLLPGVVFSLEEPGVGNRVSDGYPGDIVGTRRQVDDLELGATPTTRMVAYWHGVTKEQLADLMDVSDIAGVTWTYDHHSDAWLTVVAEGISKASALEQLRLELGVSPQATVAFGDGHNDIAMLRWAALGVAMGNAAADVRAAADEVTGTVAEDGVATVLDRLLDEGMS
ncbi:HAD family hydrolase [Kutzneria sp. NPDC052558]|uniref:HAD family hydrolase n=1 Tax=Kutzneria sp. NPDC052558 TaxID=3364121 RepID=UPI0037C71CA1